MVKVGDVIMGSFGLATVIAVFPNTNNRLVQLSYPRANKMSTTETVLDDTNTAYMVNWRSEEDIDNAKRQRGL